MADDFSFDTELDPIEVDATSGYSPGNWAPADLSTSDWYGGAGGLSPNLDTGSLGAYAGGAIDPSMFGATAVGVDQGFMGGFGGGGNSLQQLMALAAGTTGLFQGNQLQNLAKQAFSQGNPFAAYRPQYGAELSQLMQNPNSITSDPGYQFGLDQGGAQIRKQMNSQGLKASGNEALAIQQFGQGYAGNYLQQRENFLAQLAGANVTPNLTPGLSGYEAGAGLLGSGLSSYANLAGQLGASQGLAPSAGTPLGGGGGFSSAGGEAANLIRLGSAGTGLYNSVAKAGGGSSLPGSSVIGDASLGLGIYSGIQKGGVSGYGQAAADAGKLGANLGVFGDASGTIGAAAGYLAVPLSIYNFVDSWKPGATGHDALSGAEAGAAIGSVVPVVGTVIGGLIGGAVGALSSAFGSKDKSKETWVGWANGGDTQDLSKVDPSGLMWALGGLWRSGDPNFSGTKNFKDGNQFSTAMANQIAGAIKSGKASATDTPDDIYSKVVQPWIEGLPGGWNTNAKAGFGEQQLMRALTTNYMQGKPITWGESQGGKPDYQYTSLASVTGQPQGLSKPSTPVGGLASLPGIKTPGMQLTSPLTGLRG